MKRNNLMILRAVVLMVGIAFGSVQFTPKLLAQSQPSTQEDQQTQSFAGTIVKLDNGQYALLIYEEQGLGLLLDDRGKAKQFEGQKVKVSGVLDAPNGLVHVMSIVPDDARITRTFGVVPSRNQAE